MSFEPETLTLGSERDRLDSELESLVSELEGADSASKSAQMLASEARDIDQAGQAVSGLVEEYGADAEVTVRGLSAGTYAQVEDKTAEMAESKGSGVPGSSRNVYAAAGLVGAPFYDGEADDLRSKVSAIANQSVGVAKWIEGLVDERTRVDSGNWQPLAERLANSSGGSQETKS